MGYTTVNLTVTIAGDTKEQALEEKGCLIEAIQNLEEEGVLNDISVTVSYIDEEEDDDELS
tara:strand:+ start:264 stop:446 length:183 start_codon:yes stop_codon:yes gene_type:complete